MAFELPYKTLTPILGEQATYDPTAETTPDFMNGKFNELLKNDTEIAKQINVLNQLFTGEGLDLTPYLANGWTKDDWFAIKAYIVGKFVMISGVINNGIGTAGTAVLLNLPSELRNAWRSPLLCNNGICLVGYPDGSMILPHDYNGTQISISSFYRLDM